MIRKKSLILRFISASLAVFFFLQDISYAAPADLITSQAPLSQLISQDPTLFEAPLGFVTMKEVHTGTNGTFIIHIQDAHSNLSGQENLAGALNEIMSKYDVDLVLSEGGVNDCSLTPLRKIASNDVWKKVAKSYLMQGKISGEEYLNLVSDRPMKIIGIEDLGLYLTSVDNYGKLAGKREDILQYLKTIHRVLDKLKTKYYPQELLRYEKTKPAAKNQAAEINFEVQFKALLGLLKGEDDLQRFPNMQKLKTLQDKEKIINFEAANLEQSVLVEEIFRRGGKEDLESHLKKMGEMKNQKASQLAYFQNTLNIAKQKGMDIEKYANLALYLEYLKAFSEIDLDQLLDEMTKAEDGVYVQLLGAKQEPKDALLIRSIDRYVGLLDTAYQIQMTTKEFNLFKVNEPDFATIPYLAFLNRKLAEQGYMDDLLPYKSLLEDGQAALEEFYNSVDQRDTVFVQNAERILKQENRKVAVLITGGYHTSHLKNLFQEKGFSYVVLTPIVTGATDQQKYEKRLLGPIRGETKKVEIVQGESRSSGESLGRLGAEFKFKKKNDGIREILVRVLDADGAIAPDDITRLGQIRSVVDYNYALLKEMLFSAAIDQIRKGKQDPDRAEELANAAVAALLKEMSNRGQSPRGSTSRAELAAAPAAPGARLAPGISESLKRMWENRHLSYLNRHREQCEWVNRNALPEIVDRKSGEKIIRIYVLGASYGEEIARVYYETRTALERILAARGESVSEWRIEVKGFEKDPQVAQQGRARLESLNFVPGQGGEEYLRQVVDYLRANRQDFRNSIELVDADVSVPGTFTNRDAPDEVVMNATLGYLSDGDRESFIKRLYQNDKWHDAWIFGTEAFRWETNSMPEGRVLTRFGDSSSDYFALSPAWSAASLRSVRYRVSDRRTIESFWEENNRRREAAMKLLRQDDGSWVVYMDVNKLGLRDRGYSSGAADQFIVDLTRVVQEAVGQTDVGGASFRIARQDDIVCVVLPGSFDRVGAEKVLMDVQKRIYSTYRQNAYAALPLKTQRTADEVQALIDALGEDPRVLSVENASEDPQAPDIRILFDRRGYPNRKTALRAILEQAIPGAGDTIDEPRFKNMFTPFAPAGAIKYSEAVRGLSREKAETEEAFLERKWQQTMKAAENCQIAGKERKALVTIDEEVIEPPSHDQGLETDFCNTDQKEALVRSKESRIVELGSMRRPNGDAYAIEKVYGVIEQEELFKVLFDCVADTSGEQKTYIIRGPPDRFYLVLSHGNGTADVNYVISGYAVRPDKQWESLSKSFEAIRKVSGRHRRGDNESVFGFKSPNDHFGHFFGNATIGLIASGLYTGFSSPESHDSLAALETARDAINEVLSERGILIVLEASELAIDKDSDIAQKMKEMDILAQVRSSASIGLRSQDDLEKGYPGNIPPSASVRSRTENEANWPGIVEEFEDARTQMGNRAYRAIDSENRDIFMANRWLRSVVISTSGARLAENTAKPGTTEKPLPQRVVTRMLELKTSVAALKKAGLTDEWERRLSELYPNWGGVEEITKRIPNNLTEADAARLSTAIEVANTILTGNKMIKKNHDEELAAARLTSPDGLLFVSQYGARLSDVALKDIQQISGLSKDSPEYQFFLRFVEAAIKERSVTKKTPLYVAEENALLRIEKTPDGAQVFFYLNPDENAEPIGSVSFGNQELAAVAHEAIMEEFSVKVSQTSLTFAEGVLREEGQVDSLARKSVGAILGKINNSIPVYHVINLDDRLQSIPLEHQSEYLKIFKARIEAFRKNIAKNGQMGNVSFGFYSSNKALMDFFGRDPFPSEPNSRYVYHGKVGTQWGMIRGACRSIGFEAPKTIGFTPITTAKATGSEIVVLPTEGEMLLSTLVARLDLDNANLKQIQDDLDRLIKLLVNKIYGSAILTKEGLANLQTFNPKFDYLNLAVRAIEKLTIDQFIGYARMALEAIGSAA